MRQGARGAVVGAVIVLHLLALWALQAGLLHRVVSWVVPVMAVSDAVDVPPPPPREGLAGSAKVAGVWAAAVDTVMRWRYVPGKRGDVPEAMWFNVPLNFVLE